MTDSCGRALLEMGRVFLVLLFSMARLRIRFGLPFVAAPMAFHRFQTHFFSIIFRDEDFTADRDALLEPDPVTE